MLTRDLFDNNRPKSDKADLQQLTNLYIPKLLHSMQIVTFHKITAILYVHLHN